MELDTYTSSPSPIESIGHLGVDSGERKEKIQNTSRLAAFGHDEEAGESQI